MKLGRLVDAVVTPSVEEIRRFDPGALALDDSESVHRVRVATRRLRSDLKAFHACFDEGAIRHARAELAWLGERLGAVRDMDVLAERLSARQSRLSEADDAGVSQILRRVAKRHALAQRALRSASTSARYRALVDALGQLCEPTTATIVSASAWTRRGRPATVATKLSAARWKALARAVHALSAEPSSDSLLAPSDTELHDVRLLVKRCRYASEASSSVVGDDARRFAAALARVQALLGNHQDAVAAEAWLRDDARRYPSIRLIAGELIALERVERERCRGAWREVWARVSKRRRRAWM